MTLVCSSSSSSCSTVVVAVMMVLQHVLWVIWPEEDVPVLSAAFVNVAFQVHTCTVPPALFTSQPFA